MHMQRGWFEALAEKAAKAAGSSYMFGSALIIVAVWAACGPIFHFSDTWQLVINTSTTIITNLMVFLLQNSQNRQSAAMFTLISELIRTNEKARNEFIGLEQKAESEIAEAAEKVKEAAIETKRVAIETKRDRS